MRLAAKCHASQLRSKLLSFYLREGDEKGFSLHIPRSELVKFLILSENKEAGISIHGFRRERNAFYNSI